ncbi:MAG TPA: ureidoglycolate lyase [Usitatibacter sp.]|nr:ureidoglycolate lyase [Usitatibacter sp.]
MAGTGFLKLTPKPLDRASFAPFGEVIDIGGASPHAINDGTTDRYSDLARIDAGAHGDPVIGIYVARARALPLQLTRLERHREASQVFLPLGTHRFIVVVARGVETPEWDSIRAFITAPGEGVSLRRGCWHHGLVALGDGDRFAVIEGANYRNDTQEVVASSEITLLEPA